MVEGSLVYLYRFVESGKVPAGAMNTLLASFPDQLEASSTISLRPCSTGVG